MGVREHHDPGTPSSGVAQVRTNVSSVTTGSTNVSLTAGSYVIGGVTRLAQQRTDREQPTGRGHEVVHGVGDRRRRQHGDGLLVQRHGRQHRADRDGHPDDERRYRGSRGDRRQDHLHTFSEPLEPISILAGWSGSSTIITVRLISKGGSDRVQIWNKGNSAQLPIGSIMLNRTDYATKTSSFTGASMVLAGNVLTVTLGTTISTSVTTAAGTRTMRFNASATITDLAGNAASTANCNESGTADVDF
jgi:hypothetical protein